MTLNLPLLDWFWFVEYCQTSPNKNKSPNLWHVTSIPQLSLSQLGSTLCPSHYNAPLWIFGPCDGPKCRILIENSAIKGDLKFAWPLGISIQQALSMAPKRYHPINYSFLLFLFPRAVQLRQDTVWEFKKKKKIIIENSKLMQSFRGLLDISSRWQCCFCNNCLSSPVFIVIQSLIWGLVRDVSNVLFCAHCVKKQNICDALYENSYEALND